MEESGAYEPVFLPTMNEAGGEDERFESRQTMPECPFPFRNDAEAGATLNGR